MSRLGLLSLVWLAGSQAAATPRQGRDGGPPVPEELGALSLIATGDVMMHEAIKQAAEANGFAALFAQVTPLLKGADLAFGNLETPVAPKANRGTRPFVFNAPVALLPALREAGFGLLSFANNHAYDQGPAGVEETLEHLREAGLREIGAGATRAEADAPLLVQLHGITVGFLGCTARFNQNLNGDPRRPYVVPADADALSAAVSALAKTVDAVVVSVHWGNEYEPEPAQEQIDLAKRLVEAGALVILGSHPHVLQRIELLPGPDGRTALVAYSLGNFISNQSRDYQAGAAPPEGGDPRDGTLLRLTLRKRRYLGGQVVTEIGSSEALPLWTDNNAFQRKRQPKIPVDIHVVDLSKELRADRQELMQLAAEAPGFSDPQRERARELQQRVELLSTRRSRVSDRLGGDYVGPAL
jgi:Bacterial capsule synthesis protein PGA_cap